MLNSPIEQSELVVPPDIQYAVDSMFGTFIYTDYKPFQNGPKRAYRNKGGTITVLTGITPLFPDDVGERLEEIKHAVGLTGGVTYFSYDNPGVLDTVCTDGDGGFPILPNGKKLSTIIRDGGLYSSVLVDGKRYQIIFGGGFIGADIDRPRQECFAVLCEEPTIATDFLRALRDFPNETLRSFARKVFNSPEIIRFAPTHLPVPGKSDVMPMNRKITKSIIHDLRKEKG